jgi:hypothetical protein
MEKASRPGRPFTICNDLLKDFWFLLEDFFEDYIFLSFHNSSFALRYFLV